MAIREMATGDNYALTGPDPDIQNQKNWNLPTAGGKRFDTYTMGIVWEEMTPTVMAMILRDCLAISRMCRVNRTKFQIAANKPDLDKCFAFIDIQRVEDNKLATYWRSYYIKEPPDLPEHAEMTDQIQITQSLGVPQRLYLDPDFSKQVKYYDVQKISDTIPLYRSPPSGPSDWNMQEPW
jgi:hypothetical protein